MRCEYQDPHCEGPTDGANPDHGTGEPMTVVAISLYNVLHPRGYTLSPQTMALASLPEKVVQNKFLALDLTANGNQAKFSDLYNFVSNSKGFSIGSASQDYITRTHGKYFPYPGDKLVNIHLGNLVRSDPASPSRGRPTPSISLQPDWMDSPYGIWKQYPYNPPLCDKASHLTFHPGNVQSRNVLLATLALNANDVLDA
eukprot:gene23739-2878_t